MGGTKEEGVDGSLALVLVMPCRYEQRLCMHVCIEKGALQGGFPLLLGLCKPGEKRKGAMTAL